MQARGEMCCVALRAGALDKERPLRVERFSSLWKCLGQEGSSHGVEEECRDASLYTLAGKPLREKRDAAQGVFLAAKYIWKTLCGIFRDFLKRSPAVKGFEEPTLGLAGF